MGKKKVEVELKHGLDKRRFIAKNLLSGHIHQQVVALLLKIRSSLFFSCWWKLSPLTWRKSIAEYILSPLIWGKSTIQW